MPLSYRKWLWNFKLRFLRLRDLHHDGALHALAEQLTAVFVNAVDRTGGVVGVCRTAAAAIQPCPAVLAVGSGVNVAELELVLYFAVIHTVPNIAELVFVVADKLVTGIQIAPRRDRHVFGT